MAIVGGILRAEFTTSAIGNSLDIWNPDNDGSVRVTLPQLEKLVVFARIMACRFPESKG